MVSYKKALIFFLAIILFLAGVVEAERSNAGEERSFLRRQKRAVGEAEEFFLKGDYRNAIKACEDILYLARQYSGKDRYSDDLYYLAGVSSLKTGELEKAKYYLNKIVSYHKNSSLYADACIALADAYFLDEDHDKALEILLKYIRSYPSNPSTPQAYLRLGQIAQKKGTWEEAKYYFDKIKEDFPLSFEAEFVPSGANEDIFYFAVQLGSFNNLDNARTLTKDLENKGYDPYIAEVRSSDSTFYRVRVGKLESRTEAQYLANRLKKDGFQVKIYP